MNRGLSVQDSTEESTTLVPAEAPVFLRSRLTMKYFIDSMMQSGVTGSKSKVAFMMKRLVEEALDEAQEVPPEILELYMAQAAAVLHWAATGETILNMPLPADFPTESVSLTVVRNTPELESSE